MLIEDYFEFLAPREIRIKGHRVGIESILYEYIHNSLTAEEMVNRFPSLKLEQIYAAILYYLQHKDKMDKYMADWLNHGDQMRKRQSANLTKTMLKLRQFKQKTH